MDENKHIISSKNHIQYVETFKICNKNKKDHVTKY